MWECVQEEAEVGGRRNIDFWLSLLTAFLPAAEPSKKVNPRSPHDPTNSCLQWRRRQEKEKRKEKEKKVDLGPDPSSTALRERKPKFASKISLRSQAAAPEDGNRDCIAPNLAMRSRLHNLTHTEKSTPKRGSASTSALLV